MLTTLRWDLLALFTLMVLSVTLYALSAAAHFPRARRSSALATSSGTRLIWMATVATAISALVVTIIAGTRLPWSSMIITGGAMVLAAPLLLRTFSDPFLDGPGALFAFAACAAAIAGACLYL